MTNEPTTQPGTKEKTGWLNIAVDYGPLIAFLGVYKFYSWEEKTSIAQQVSAVIAGTVAFMITAVIALAFSKLKFGRVSPMLWLSTGLIVVFGALTIWFRDERFIQMKPTLIYALFGAALLIGWMRRVALVQILLGTVFEGVDAAGWLKLSRNWGLFFFALAVLNEVLRAQLSFESWLWAKIWVFMPLSFLFILTQIPMLLKHGLNLGGEDEVDVLKDQPPTGE